MRRKSVASVSGSTSRERTLPMRAATPDDLARIVGVGGAAVKHVIRGGNNSPPHCVNLMRPHAAVRRVLDRTGARNVGLTA
jgi:hypothetical protein